MKTIAVFNSQKLPKVSVSLVFTMVKNVTANRKQQRHKHKKDD